MSAESILRHWGDIPTSYISYDLETTGTVCGHDLLWEFGYCEVADGEAVNYESVVLNWFQEPAINPRWLSDKIDAHRRAMAAADKNTNCSVERIASGHKPSDVLLLWAMRFHRAMCVEQRPLLGHGIVRFDNRMFAANVRSYVGFDLQFAPNMVIDTAALEKAIQLGMTPKPEETMIEFWRRVHKEYAPGVYFNLDRHCVGKYFLKELYGLEPGKFHSAGYDAMAAHLTFQEMLRTDEDGEDIDDGKTTMHAGRE